MTRVPLDSEKLTWSPESEARGKTHPIPTRPSQLWPSEENPGARSRALRLGDRKLSTEWRAHSHRPRSLPGVWAKHQEAVKVAKSQQLRSIAFVTLLPDSDSKSQKKFENCVSSFIQQMRQKLFVPGHIIGSRAGYVSSLLFSLMYLPVDPWTMQGLRTAKPRLHTVKNPHRATVP